LERAISIAQRHDAQLIILHVFEDLDESTLTYARHSAPSWRRPPDAVTMMKQRIRQGLQAELGEAVDRATLLLEGGVPAEVIEQVVESERVDLVVTGIAREGLFASRPMILGKTVEQLIRRLSVPTLIVRNRARSNYQHIVVTTDFSPPSGYALQVALRFFPAQSLHLLHAAEAPYATLVADSGKHAKSFQEIRTTDLEAFLAATFMPENDRQRIVPVVEPGAPQQLVREYAQMHGADLVVLGTHGRGAILEAVLGSTAKNILATLPCDALVVRGPRQ
jgi:nucleotide-binding universal stress UspA family protein